jgi:hypothetical protein
MFGIAAAFCNRLNNHGDGLVLAVDPDRDFVMYDRLLGLEHRL